MDQSKLDKLLKKFKRNPENAELFEELYNYFIENNQWRETALLCEEFATSQPSPEKKEKFLLKSASIWLDKTNEPQEGIKILNKILLDNPLNTKASLLIEEYLKNNSTIDEILDFYYSRIETLKNLPQKSETKKFLSYYYQQLGDIFLNQYKQPEEGIKFYHQAFEYDPENIMAIYSAREYYKKIGDFESAVQLYFMEIQVETDLERKVALYRELAHITAEYLNNIDEAIFALKEAYNLAGKNREVIGELGIRVIQRYSYTLDPLDFDYGIMLFKELVESFPDEVSLEYLMSALYYLPQSTLLDFTIDLANKLNKITYIIQHLEQLLSYISEDPVVWEIYRRLAKLYLQIGKKEEAYNYLKALEEFGDPNDLELISNLKREFEGEILSSEKDELLYETEFKGIYGYDEGKYPGERLENGYYYMGEEKIESEIDHFQEGLIGDLALDRYEKDKFNYKRITELKEKVDLLKAEGREDEAEEYMRLILEIDPSDSEALSFLEKRYRAREDWVALGSLLERIGRINKIPLPTRKIRLIEAANIYEERLKNIDKTIQALKEIIKIDPQSQDIKERLELLFIKYERWRELIELYELYAVEALSIEEKRERLKKIAQIYLIRINDPISAINTYKRALDLIPNDKELLDALYELYLRESRWEELLEILNKKLSLTQKDEEKLDIYLKQIDILYEKLHNFEEAYKKAKEGVSLFPGNRELFVRLELMNKERGDWERLLNIYRYQAGYETDIEEKVRLLNKAGEIAKYQLKDIHLCIEIYESIRGLGYHDNFILGQLGKMYEEVGESNEALTIYEELLEREKLEKEEKIEVLKSIGNIYYNQGEENRAVSYYEQLLNYTDDVDVIRYLIEYYEREGEWDKVISYIDRVANLIPREEQPLLLLKKVRILRDLGRKSEVIKTVHEIIEEYSEEIPTEFYTIVRKIYEEDNDIPEASKWLEIELKYTSDQQSRKELLFKLGSWYKDILKQKERAIEIFLELYELDPTNISVFEILEKLYVDIEDWESLLRLIEIRIDRATSDEEKRTFILAGAAICEEKLQDMEKGWSWYKQLIYLKKIPLSKNIELLEEIGEKYGLWGELIDLYGEIIDKTQDLREQAKYWKKIGDIYRDSNIADLNKSLESYLRAFALSKDPKLLDIIEEVALKSGSLKRLIKVYDSFIRIQESKENKLKYALRIAYLIKEKTPDKKLAFELFKKGFELDPLNDEILKNLEEITAQLHNWRELFSIYDMRLGLLEEIQQKCELLWRCAKVCAYAEELAEDIFNLALKAFSLEESLANGLKNMEEVIQILAKVTQDRGSWWKRYITFLRKEVDSLEEAPNIQVILLKTMADIVEREFSDGALAFELIKEASSIMPENLELYARLEELANKYGYFIAMVEHLKKLIENLFDKELVKELNKRLAIIYEERLGDFEKALERWWQLWQLSPLDEYITTKLITLYTQLGRWHDLVLFYKNLLKKIKDVETEKTILYLIADTYLNKLNNRVEAIDIYKKIISRFPEEEKAKEIVATLERGEVKPFASSIDKEDLISLGIISSEEELLNIRLSHEEEAPTEKEGILPSLDSMAKKIKLPIKDTGITPIINLKEMGLYSEDKEEEKIETIEDVEEEELKSEVFSVEKGIVKENKISEELEEPKEIEEVEEVVEVEEVEEVEEMEEMKEIVDIEEMEEVVDIEEVEKIEEVKEAKEAEEIEEIDEVEEIEDIESGEKN